MNFRNKILSCVALPAFVLLAMFVGSTALRPKPNRFSNGDLI